MFKIITLVFTVPIYCTRFCVNGFHISRTRKEAELKCKRYIIPRRDKYRQM